MSVVEVFRAVPGHGSTVPLGAQSGVGRQRPRPGQGSTALRGRRFAGQVFVKPNAAGRVGFIESAAAQVELACGGDFPVLRVLPGALSHR